jgi:hypothetical protein
MVITLKFMLNDCPGRICLTSDLWTSLTTDGYMCLTAHFIDKNWVLTRDGGRGVGRGHGPPSVS